MVKPLRVKGRGKNPAFTDAIMFAILERMLNKAKFSSDARLMIWTLTLAGHRHDNFSVSDELLEKFLPIAEQIYQPITESTDAALWDKELTAKLAYWEPELRRLRQEVEYC